MAHLVAVSLFLWPTWSASRGLRASLTLLQSSPDVLFAELSHFSSIERVEVVHALGIQREHEPQRARQDEDPAEGGHFERTDLLAGASDAELIRSWRPWEKSTGPQTSEGKAKAARNGYKGGTWRLLRELARALREQENGLKGHMGKGFSSGR